MNVLVAYASRYGATAGIAERIAERMRAAGHETEVAPVSQAPPPTAYDAVVLGSAVYIGRWEKEGVAYLDEHREALLAKPTWLFSSGPLGTAEYDAEGKPKAEGAVSADQERALTEAVRPREHRVFFGALDPAGLGLGPRLMRILPAGRKLLEEGDFRDWAAIDAWADAIATELAVPRTPAPVG